MIYTHPKIWRKITEKNEFHQQKNVSFSKRRAFLSKKVIFFCLFAKKVLPLRKVCESIARKV